MSATQKLLVVMGVLSNTLCTVASGWWAVTSSELPQSAHDIGAVSASPAVASSVSAETWVRLLQSQRDNNATVGAAIRDVALYGDPQSHKIIFIVPQVHNSPTMPLVWSSLGDDIAFVQNNIGIITSTLFDEMHLYQKPCLGVEGLSDNAVLQMPIRYDADILQHDLVTQSRILLKTLRYEYPRDEARWYLLEQELSKIQKIGAALVDKRLQMTDGSGISVAAYREKYSQYKSKDDKKIDTEILTYFGIENQQLLDETLRTWQAYSDLQQNIQQQQESHLSASDVAFSLLWEKEYPDYEKSVVLPWRHFLQSLTQIRQQSSLDGADDAEKSTAKMISVLRAIDKYALQIDDVMAWQKHWQTLANLPPAVDKTSQNKNPQPSDQKSAAQPTTKKDAQEAAARAKKLQELLDKLTWLGGTAREEAAIARVLDKMPAVGSCIVLMGQEHETGLVAAIERINVQKNNTIAAIVVSPAWPPIKTDPPQK